MSNYPEQLDDDVSLPPVNDNLDDIGEEAVNSLRDAVINIEQFVGTGISGTMSLAQRLGVLVSPDGYFNFSTLTSMGLLTFPIYDAQIANGANIQESKLNLTFGTQDLFNDISLLSQSVTTVTNWISVSGVKLEPHLVGAIYRHDLTNIDVIESSVDYLNSVFRTATVSGNVNRIDHNGNDNVNSFLMLNNINNELTFHQWADGSPPPYTLADNYISSTVQNILTNGGATFPSNYGHTASGIYLNSSAFENTPRTIQDVQAFANYVDSNIFEVETTVKNLFANGIARNSSSSILTSDGYGQLIIPNTIASSYLSTTGSPIDSYYAGDDIIEFTPASNDGYAFDAQFALVRIGDIIHINYGPVEVSFVIKEKKYDLNKYAVRIAGKNLFNTTDAIASINRPTFNNNKSGVLATALVNGTASYPASLIIGNPRGAQVLSVGFNPDLFDGSHYNLYLMLYPYGNISDGYVIPMPAIDVTGNKGSTPGQYTLDGIVAATNNQFRQRSYNLRFIAFSYQGEFGIMLADSYNNASFSIVNFVIGSSGINSTASSNQYPQNIIDASGLSPDPLGFGMFGANVASPAYTSYANNNTAYTYPTKLFVPLKKNNFYLNGQESSTLSLPDTIDGYQQVDQFGDGYWIATLTSSSPNVIYTIPFALNNVSNLAPGKTLVVQSLTPNSNFWNFGRFTISAVNTICGTNPTTSITVYDAIHAAPGQGRTPSNPETVAIYFNSDSIVFNAENSSDISSPSTPVFKSYFEIYIGANENTYPLERGRMFNSSSLVNGINIYSNLNYSSLNISKISSKLRGYLFGYNVNKITLQLQSFDPTTGIYSGLLCNTSDGLTYTNLGPLTYGKVGEVVRFYDETNIDYIDFIFDAKNFPTSLLNALPAIPIDVQLFPTLSLDKEDMLLANCQLTVPYTLDHFQDRRQFGNVSEQELTTSALDYIAEPTKLLNENGIIRGFETSATIDGYGRGVITITGGVAVVNGKIVKVNNTTIQAPIVLENIFAEGSGMYNNTYGTINWFVCVNDKSEIELVASTDFISPNSSYGDLDNTRLFYVKNTNVSPPISYIVRSTYLADLVLNQKDIVPIAIVESVVKSDGTAILSCNSSDMRRYVGNGYGGLAEPFILSQNGSFRSFASINTWLNQLNNYISATNSTSNQVSNKVIIKGNIDIDTTAIYLNYNNPVQFVGDGGIITVTIATGLNIGNNISFDNITFNYNYDPFVAASDSYAPSYAQQLINVENALISIDYIGNTTSIIDNVSIVNCDFIWNPSPQSFITNRYPFICVKNSNAGTIASNIIISNNNFSSNSNSSFSIIDDSLGAIVFIDLSPNPPSVGFYPQLLNCEISSNTFDKNQMIAITTMRNATNDATATVLINSAFNTINVIIEKNNCGAISVINAEDQVFISGNQAYKNYSTIISENTCNYISSIDGSGLSVYGAGATNIYTGIVIVKGNTCNWIDFYMFPSIAWPVYAISFIKINENTLVANNIAIKNKYYTGSGILNSAISVNSSQVYGESIINNNVISYSNNNAGATGANAITISGNPCYAYSTAAINAGTNTIIENNIVSGLMPRVGLTPGADGISLYGNTAIVKGNKIYRGSNIINSYINGNSTTGAQYIITDNFFDNTTIDNGSNENTAANIPSTSICIRNKNQIGYTIIPFSANSFSYIDTGSLSIVSLTTLAAASSNVEVFTDTGTLSSSSYNNINILITDTGVAHNISIMSDVGNQIPEGTQILLAKIGIANNGAGAISSGTLAVTLSSQDTNFNSNSFSSPTNTILDPAWNNLAANVDNVRTTQGLSIGGTTIFISVTPNDFTKFVSTKTRNIVCNLQMNIDLSTANSIFTISPLVVKYKW